MPRFRRHVQEDPVNPERAARSPSWTPEQTADSWGHARRERCSIAPLSCHRCQKNNVRARFFVSAPGGPPTGWFYTCNDCGYRFPSTGSFPTEDQLVLFWNTLPRSRMVSFSLGLLEELNWLTRGWVSRRFMGLARWLSRGEIDAAQSEFLHRAVRDLGRVYLGPYHNVANAWIAGRGHGEVGDTAIVQLPERSGIWLVSAGLIVQSTYRENWLEGHLYQVTDAGYRAIGVDPTTARRR